MTTEMSAVCSFFAFFFGYLSIRLSKSPIRGEEQSVGQLQF